MTKISTHWIYALVVAGMLLLSGCKGSDQAKGFYKAQDSETQGYLDAWKADPYGCQMKRTAYQAEQFLPAMIKEELSQEAVESLLGKPEMIVEVAGRRELGYYFDARCENGKPAEGSVYCLLKVYIDLGTGKTVSGNVICG